MSWENVADLLAAVCFLSACAFALIAALGMSRFPDLLTRMHAATKPQVVGLLLSLVGLALRLREPSVLGVIVLIGAAQAVTSPVASHMIARAAFRAGQVRQDLLVTDELSEALDHEEPRGAP